MIGRRARTSVVALAALATALSVGCTTSCDCGPESDALSVEIAEPLLPGIWVEVCFGDDCGAVDIPEIEEAARTGSVPFATLGRWADDRERPVAVRVRGPSGRVLSEREAVPEEHSSCCGPYWTVGT